jgi:hypothetical protein
MTWWQWLLLSAGVALAIYAALVGALMLAGRRQDARAIAGFIPDCIVLFRRLLGDERVPRRSKLLLTALIGYLALPFDLSPTSSLSPDNSTTRSSSRSCSDRSCAPAAHNYCANTGPARPRRSTRSHGWPTQRPTPSPDRPDRPRARTPPTARK